MSLILMMIYWVLLPFLVFRSAWWLFVRAKSLVGRVLVVIAATGMLGWFLWVAVGENMYWDAKVRELCAKDGGVKVHETVTLPADLYEHYASMNWVLPDKRLVKPTDEYYWETANHYYRKGNPQVSRTQYRIIRRSDGKVLGESIYYGRGSGGLYGPWHGSSFICPDPTNRNNKPFPNSIFMKGNSK